MKIAVFYNLPSGGGRRCILELSRALTKKHTLDLYGLAIAGDNQVDPIGIFNAVYRFDCRYLYLKRPLGTFNILINFLNFYILENTYKKIAQAINKGGYEVAFVHASYWDWLAAPDLLKYLKVPSVYYCQEPYRRYYEPQYFTLPFKSLTYLPKLRRLLLGPFYKTYDYCFKIKDKLNIRCAKMVLANSFYSRENIARVYGVSAKVNYLGVDSLFFKPLGLPKENVIISVGVLEERRGHHFVIEAVAMLSENIRPKIAIISPYETEEVQEYKERLKCLAVEKEVEISMHIGINDEELRVFYNKAKLTVCAFLGEPFGLVALESMSCATAVVAFREGGLKESISDGQNGRLVSRDIKELSRAIEGLLMDEKVRVRLGENARQDVLDRWTWDKSADTLEEYFSQVIKNERKADR